jgi:hypothetical protein
MLPRRWTLTAGAGANGSETVWTIGEHAAVIVPGVEGTDAIVQLPGRVESRSPEGTTSGVSFAIAGAHRAADADFARPERRAGDIAFDGALPADLEVVKAPTGHLLVPARVNGEDVGWFIFDTGAGINVVSKKLAERLGLRQLGEVPATGAGGTSGQPLYRPASLGVGRATLAEPLVMGLDLEFLSAPMGREIAGIVGFGVLARSVAEIDMAGPRVALHDPATYALPAGGAWQDLIVTDRIPAVRAAFAVPGGEPRAGLFRIDTGAAQWHVTFHTGAVEAWALVEGRTDLQEARLGGVGGSVPAKRGPLAWFEMGDAIDPAPGAPHPRRVERIEAHYNVTRRGAFANDDLAGTIGGQMLRPFVMITDYGRERVAFVRKGE